MDQTNFKSINFKSLILTHPTTNIKHMISPTISHNHHERLCKWSSNWSRRPNDLKLARTTPRQHSL